MEPSPAGDLEARPVERIGEGAGVVIVIGGGDVYLLLSVFEAEAFAALALTFPVTIPVVGEAKHWPQPQATQPRDDQRLRVRAAACLAVSENAFGLGHRRRVMRLLLRLALPRVGSLLLAAGCFAFLGADGGQRVVAPLA